MIFFSHFGSAKKDSQYKWYNQDNRHANEEDAPLVRENRQEARYATYTDGGCLNIIHRQQHTTNRGTDHTKDKRITVTDVNTKDRRLGYPEEG